MDEVHPERKEELTHDQNSPPFKCDESDSVMSAYYKCDNCSYNASSEYELKLHIKAVHINKENAINSCHRGQGKIDNNCPPCHNMKLKNLDLEHQNAALKLK